jgi:hypothetical protein
MHGSVKDKVYKMGIGSPTREMLQNTASTTIKLPVPPVSNLLYHKFFHLFKAFMRQ